MRYSPIALVLAIVLTGMVPSYGQTISNAPQVSLRNAQNAYAFGDYRAVISGLTPILEPDVLLSDANDQASAYELLGLAHFFLEARAESRVYFERLIRLRPYHMLDPVRVPPPAISYFEEIKTALKPELEKTRAALAAQQAAEEKRRRQENLLRIERDVRVNSKLLAVMPFGAGQFQNGDPLLGGLFLGGQLITALTSIVSYALIEDLRGTDGRFRPDEASRARQLQTAQISSGSAAVLLMVVGATQAILNFKETRLIREKTYERKGPSSMVRVGPVGLSLTF